MVLFSTKIWWTFDGFESGSCCTNIYNTIDNDDINDSTIDNDDINDINDNDDGDNDGGDDDDCSRKKLNVW